MTKTWPKSPRVSDQEWETLTRFVNAVYDDGIANCIKLAAYKEHGTAGAIKRLIDDAIDDLLAICSSEEAPEGDEDEEDYSLDQPEEIWKAAPSLRLLVHYAASAEAVPFDFLLNDMTLNECHNTFFDDIRQTAKHPD